MCCGDRWIEVKDVLGIGVGGGVTISYVLVGKQ
jgi:hypothetical protein